MSSVIFDDLQNVSKNFIPRYDLHMHTTWTDGSQSSYEMHQAAVEQGLQKILFSEHARKTSGDWFSKFAKEIRALPQDHCRAYVGVETKIIDFQGGIDLTDDIIECADFVMASVHRFPGEEGIVSGRKDYTYENVVDLEFRLALAALDNTNVDILGHPFGMCYRRFGFTPPDDKFQELIKKAAQTGVAIEVNIHYHPDPWRIIGWCQKLGAKISLGSNAHNTADVGKVIRVLEGKESPWIPLKS